jgi:uncharacterized protein (DUF2336 family)
MSLADHFGIIREVDDAIAQGSPSRRGEILGHVTTLFLTHSERYSEEEIALFDGVIARLAADIELAARTLLAERLAPVANAPTATVRMLALDDAIEVAQPILLQSPRIDARTLIEAARTKSAHHLLAIARRPSLDEAVTDILAERGDREVGIVLAENQGARLSERGFASLITRCSDDDGLTLAVGARPEIPVHLFLQLLAAASESVRQKLEAEHPHARREVDQVVAEVTSRIRAETVSAIADYSTAEQLVRPLHETKRLDEKKVEGFAKAGKFEETVVALALMSDMPLTFVERAMTASRPETLLVLAKALGLSWSCVKAILWLRAGSAGLSPKDIEQFLASFERLKRSTAQELVRFHRTRAVANAKPA